MAAHQASLSITNSQSLLKFMSIESVMSSNHLILCHPLLLPSIFPSIRVFSNESAFCIRWPKYWSFLGISPIYCPFYDNRVQDEEGPIFQEPHFPCHPSPPLLHPVSPMLNALTRVQHSVFPSRLRGAQCSLATLLSEYIPPSDICE